MNLVGIQLYLAVALSPLFWPRFNPYALIYTLGLISLIIGVGLGLRARETRLLLFALPAVIAHAVMTWTFFVDGRGYDDGKAWLALTPFLAVQAILIGALIYFCRRALRPAVFLGIFMLTYSYHMAGMGVTTLTGTWP